MNPAFIDVLDELAAENAECFRSHGVALKLALRSKDRPKNSQVLVLSHTNWESEIIVWDSGEAELTSMANGDVEPSILVKYYATPQEMRNSLREWLLARVKV